MSRMKRKLAAALAAIVSLVIAPCVALAAPLTEDIRDIRGPIAMPPWWRWPLGVAIALLATLAIVLAVRLWRARSRRARSPVEQARYALALAETHAREGRSREWAEIVAETLRTGLTALLGFDVRPRTTEELLRVRWAKPPLDDEANVARLTDLLRMCDLARFAKASLAPDALLASTAASRELVELLFAPPPKPQPTSLAIASVDPQLVTP